MHSEVLHQLRTDIALMMSMPRKIYIIVKSL